MSLLLVSFAIFRTVSKGKKDVLVKSSALLDFLYSLKMITVISKLLIFFSLTHTFFPLPQPFFRVVFPIKSTQRRSLRDSQKHSVTICYIYGLLLLSRAPQNTIDTTVSKPFISSVYIRTAKISYSKSNIFHSAPLKRNFPYPIITIPTPCIVEKFKSH